MVRFESFRGFQAGLALSAVIAHGFIACGCGGDEAPPYDALPLRDALRAAPEVMASLSEEARHSIALRLEEDVRAGRDGGDSGVAAGTTLIPARDPSTIDALANAADDIREQNGKDALVLGEIEREETGLVLLPQAVETEKTDEPSVELPILKGRPTSTTKELEEKALEGRAGRWISHLAKKTNAHEMVRTTGLPMGVWALDDTLYVNASWLVALSSLEEKEEAAKRAPAGWVGGAPGGATETPGTKPLSVDFNPYNLPDAVAECASQVKGTCSCAQNSTCDHATTDVTFADANEECTWVNASANNAAALCVLALLSIDGVRACVESAGTACSELPVSTREDALLFVANDGCMNVLDQCLANGSIDRPSSSGGSSGCSSPSCSGCSSCGESDCDKCNDDCSKCNDNCAQCNDNCRDCNQNNKDCNDNCKGNGASAYAGSAKCTIARPVGRSPIPSPVGTAFWLFAPLAYLYLVSQRRQP